MLTADNLHPGDWVNVRAKVMTTEIGNVGVELFSKTDQYTAYVRPDLCEKISRPLPDEPQTLGSAVWSVHKGKGVVYQRFIDDGWRAPGSERRYSWAEVCNADDRGEPELLAP